MSEGKRRDEWSRWASWMALFGNCNRDPKKSQPFTPSDFDPFAKRAPRQKLNKTDSVKHLSVLFGAKRDD